MKHRFTRAMFATLLWLLPHQAFSQTADAGITVVGLASFQPVDDAYVGGPYLNEGIGGAAIGFGAGINVISPGGFVAAVEYSTARYELEQSGRLVAGEGVTATTELHDSLISGLVGVAIDSGKTRLVALAGIGALLDDPTVDGDPREANETNHDRGWPFVPIGGLELIQSFNRRAALAVGLRYGFADRPENQRYLGVGPHILRVGAGIRVKIN